MKKNFIYLTMLLFVMLSCNKSEVVPLFDESANKRVTTIVDGYKKQLAGAENGWRGEYYPDGGKTGGYSFYLKFDANGKVVMYSDIDDRNYSGGGSYFGNGYDKSFETTYQVKTLQKPTLVFDSYSYLHELVNPDYNGGTGQVADLELAFDTSTDSKITLVGTVNKTQMILTKITKTESDLLAKGGLASIFNSTLGYLNTDKFLTLVFPTGEKSDVNLDFASKTISIYSINSRTGDIDIASSQFVTTVTGLQLKTAITLYGVTFQEMLWDSVLKVYYINSGGRRINFVQSSRPGLPFYYALGTLFVGFDMNPNIPSQSAEYKALYAKIKSNVIALSTAPPARVINDVFFQYLPDDGIFVLVIGYRRTDAAGAIVFDGAGVLYYEPALDARGNISFKRLATTATLSGGQITPGISAIVATGVKPLTDILETNTFTWDYDPIETRIAVLKSNAQTTAITIKGEYF